MGQRNSYKGTWRKQSFWFMGEFLWMRNTISLMKYCPILLIICVIVSGRQKDIAGPTFNSGIRISEFTILDSWNWEQRKPECFTGLSGWMKSAWWVITLEFLFGGDLLKAFALFTTPWGQARISIRIWGFMCSYSFSRFYFTVISPQSNANVLNGVFQNLACVSLVGHEIKF